MNVYIEDTALPSMELLTDISRLKVSFNCSVSLGIKWGDISRLKVSRIL